MATWAWGHLKFSLGGVRIRCRKFTVSGGGHSLWNFQNGGGGRRHCDLLLRRLGHLCEFITLKSFFYGVEMFPHFPRGLKPEPPPSLWLPPYFRGGSSLSGLWLAGDAYVWIWRPIFLRGCAFVTARLTPRNRLYVAVIPLYLILADTRTYSCTAQQNWSISECVYLMDGSLQTRLDLYTCVHKYIL